ncbi:hypothetical protein BH20ACT2_BH20ACT2_01170 [soil metagenome]
MLEEGGRPIIVDETGDARTMSTMDGRPSDALPGTAAGASVGLRRSPADLHR